MIFISFALAACLALLVGFGDASIQIVWSSFSSLAVRIPSRKISTVLWCRKIILSWRNTSIPDPRRNDHCQRNEPASPSSWWWHHWGQQSLLPHRREQIKRLSIPKHQLLLQPRSSPSLPIPISSKLLSPIPPSPSTPN